MQNERERSNLLSQAGGPDNGRKPILLKVENPKLQLDACVSAHQQPCEAESISDPLAPKRVLLRKEPLRDLPRSLRGIQRQRLDFIGRAEVVQEIYARLSAGDARSIQWAAISVVPGFAGNVLATRPKLVAPLTSHD